MLLVTDDRFTAETEAKARRLLREHLRCDDAIVVERVEAIPPSPSGKHCLVVSKVAERLRAEGRFGPVAE